MVFIKKGKSQYVVYIPDFDIYTEGKDIAEAIYMARDAIGTYGLSFKSDDDVPTPLNMQGAREKTLRCADREDFKYSEGITTFVDIDFSVYSRKIKNKSIKKNCTIPMWLSEEAEAEGINFSRVLQEALIEKLNNVKMAYPDKAI